MLIQTIVKTLKGFHWSTNQNAPNITLKTHLRIGPIYNNWNFSKIWRWVTWFERYSNHEVLSRWQCSMFRWYVPCRTLTIDKKLNICCYLWFVWNFNLSFMVFLVVNIDHTKVNDVARELYNRLGAFTNTFNFDEFINFTQCIRYCEHLAALILFWSFHWVSYSYRLLIGYWWRSQSGSENQYENGPETRRGV